MTRDEFIQIFDNNLYDLFKLPYNSLKPFIDIPPISKRDKRDKNVKGIKRYNTYYTIQDVGDNKYMYDSKIVPIAFYTLEHECYGPTPVIRYIGHSIDDSSQGFWLKTKAESNKTLKDAYQIIIDYLLTHPNCQTNDDFIAWFGQYKPDFYIDYKFN